MFWKYYTFIVNTFTNKPSEFIAPRTHKLITSFILFSPLLFQHPYPLLHSSLTVPLLFYLLAVVPATQLSLLLITVMRSPLKTSFLLPSLHSLPCPSLWEEVIPWFSAQFFFSFYYRICGRTYLNIASCWYQTIGIRIKNSGVEHRDICSQGPEFLEQSTWGNQ